MSATSRGAGNVLAVDQGTSGTKALVVSPDRGVLGAAEAALRPRYGAGGLVEQDPGELFASVVAAGRQAIEKAGEPVDAVGLANQGETVLAWDPSTGEPLTQALVWQDRRATHVCARLADHSPRLAELTGLSLDPYFAAPKMVWLRENRTREGVITTTDAWLVHRLTGAFVTDASTASRTMLLDLDSGAWSQEALALFGMEDEPLPEIVDAGGCFGETELFGNHPVPLTGLLVDQQAALLAEHCLVAGTAKCTYGTGAFLMANVGSVAARSIAGLTTSVAWRLGGAATYCLDGQVPTAGSAVRWLSDLGVLASPEGLDQEGESVPDSGGVTFVPALGDAHGSLSGLALGTTRAHVVRALLDGIASQVAELATAAAADLGQPLRTLRVDGGLTRSRLLMQTQADLLQTPVEVFASANATALGVAAAARLGLDPTLQVVEALEPWHAIEVYEPCIGADEAAERLARFGAMADRSLETPLCCG